MIAFVAGEPLNFVPLVDPWTFAAILAAIFGVVAFVRSAIRDLRRRAS